MTATTNKLTRTRNFGIVAHVDAGKTTTTERILFLSGAQHTLGDVDRGNTTTDFMRLEQEKGITIQSAAVAAQWTVGEHKFDLTLIDTPGHVDFTMEVERSMRVLDGVVVLLCAKGGVQPQTRTVWRQANRYKVPRVVFINKLDTIGADFEKAIRQLRVELKAKVAICQLPIGQKAEFGGVVDLLSRKAMVWDTTDDTGRTFSIEAVPASMQDDVEIYRDELVQTIIDNDDDLTVKFVEGIEIGEDELRLSLRKSTIALTLVPVLCGSAFKKQGVQPLLDAVVNYLPSPLEVPDIKGTSVESKDTVITRRTDDSEPLSALAFKLVDDEHGDLIFVRVYSGILKSGKQVYNPRLKRMERVGHIYRMQADQRIAVEQLGAGEIGGVIGLKETNTGDTLCTREKPLFLESIVCPDPVISLALEPESGNREAVEQVIFGLARLQRADPSFRYWTDKETAQIIIAGLGELHLEIKVALLAEMGIVVRTGRPQVGYRETISHRVVHEEKLQKQNGGRGMFAQITIQVEPAERGSGFEFEDCTTGGVVSANFVRAVERGLKEAMGSGPLGGYPLVDIKVSLLDGKMHAVDSNDTAFSIAAAEGLQAACKSAHPILLEPVLKMDFDLPPEYIGAVIGDIRRLRGQVVSTDVQTDSATISAEIPLEPTFGYVTQLRSATKGKASCQGEPLRYDPAPEDVRRRFTEGHK